MSNIFTFSKRTERKITSLHETISPCAFLTRRNILVKYQNRDLAITWLVAKICILYNGGLGSFSDGNFRPITVNSFS